MRPLANFSVYTVGSILQSGISLLLLPIYVRYLTPAEYGVISILLVVHSMITLATGLGVPSGFYRLYFDGRRDALLTGAILWRLSATLPAFAAVAAGGKLLSTILFTTGAYDHAIMLVGLSVVLTSLQELMMLTLRLEQRARLFVTYALFSAVLSFALKYAYLVQLQWGVDGYWISQVLADGGAALLMVLHLRLWRRLVPLRFLLIKDMLRVGFPYTFSTIGVWVIDSTGKLLLNALVGAAAVGVYALALRIASLFAILVTSPLQLWWGPYAFERAAQEGVETFKRITQRFNELVLVGTVLGVCLIPLAGLVIAVLPGHEEYRQAIPLVLFCTIPYAFQALAVGFGAQFVQTKRTHYVGIGGVIAAVVSVGANVLLLPVVGVSGAVAANILAYGVWLGIYYLAAQRELPIAYSRRHLAQNSAILAVHIIVLLATAIFRSGWYQPIWLVSSLCISWLAIILNRRHLFPLIADFRALIKK